MGSLWLGSDRCSSVQFTPHLEVPLVFGPPPPVPTFSKGVKAGGPLPPTSAQSVRT